MSLFEDLVEELKEDNLLEETVIDSVNKTVFGEEVKAVSIDPVSSNNVMGEAQNPVLVSTKSHIEEDTVEEIEQIEKIDSATIETFEDQMSVNIVDEPKLVKEDSNLDNSPKVEVDNSSNEEKVKDNIITTLEESKRLLGNEKEFYRLRAIDEVSGLEMVEHVLTSVEREMMKIIPKVYEDHAVKQALREFLKVADDIKSPDHATAEFRLMQETENWYSTLSRRDRNISVGHLRVYCETTKPSLSSQALLSLARFYRNSPFSESVRSKFDLVITKLFSKEIGYSRRELLFKQEEIVKHITGLYAEWSSVPLYSTDEDDSDLLLSALKFHDFIDESMKADSFDELIKKDFFKRLKVFKEVSSENFFSPILVSAAIESNVIVGNRFVELLEKEKANKDIDKLSDKYALLNDKSISESTSKTLELVEILKVRKPEILEPTDKVETAEHPAVSSVSKSKEKETPKNKSLLNANKWLVFATIITVIFASVYFLVGGQANSESGVVQTSTDVKIVNLDNSSLKEYVDSARIKGKTLFAITKEGWGKLSYSEKEEVLRKFQKTGGEKEFEKVHLLDKKGATVGFASKDGIINKILLMKTET